MTTGASHHCEPVKTFVVERYWPGVSVERAEAVIAREASLVEAMTAEGRPIRVLYATLVEADETVMSVVEALSWADVVELGERSGTPADRVVPARAMETRSAAGHPAVPRTLVPPRPTSTRRRPE